ncbi:TonB-dependent receptor [Sphingomonas sp.]|uniref:TonB-dependent receptor n=1 Tax=Sphingomonas sp. TaxID=28214 RepID=UPI001ED1F9B0|nr:TonB-dependent receptor [Sphingomonas sp.]MBX3595057.1 TonB-dependent receptor [Sphingomonas sp.]
MNMLTRFKTTASALSLALVLIPATAFAAGPGTAGEADPAAPAQDGTAPADTSSGSNDIVVTGTASKGLKRLDAGFSITTVDAETIQRTTPLSTADVLKTVPGTYIESSGGVAGLRVGVRGFPMNGGGQFSTVQIDGTTLLPPNTLSFIESFSMFRIDDTVERVEVLRGGPSPIFSNGQPGITLNFIQKTGKDTPEGSARVTVGAEGLYRFDGFVGGKIGEGWYATVGGFYRVSDGVRDPQYKADQGGQISGTLTRRFDTGEITFWARRVKDSNIFFTGAPLLVGTDGKLRPYSYFDQRKDTLAGEDTRLLTFETSAGTTPGTTGFDFSDGRTIDLTQFGGNFEFTPGDWRISGKVGYLTGTTDTRAIFTSAVPTTISAYIAGRVTAINATPSIVAAGGVATGGTAKFSSSGATITDGNQPVIVAGFWAVDKSVETFTTDLRVSRDLGDHAITLGSYFASHRIGDLWYQGNNALLAFEPNARRIDVTLNNGAQITKNGFTGFATNNFSDSFSGTNIAGFLADEWTVNDRLRIDGGLRLEHYKVSGSVGLASNSNLDGNVLTVYNNSVSVLNGQTRSADYSKTQLSYTAGANYYITPRVTSFLRINSGFRFPTFDEVQGGFRTVQKIKQYELGFKTASRFLDASLTFFRNDFVGQTYSQQIVNPTTNAITTVIAVAGSRTWGAELEGAIRPVQNLSIGFNATAFRARFRDIDSGVASGVQNGYKVPRQPDFQARISPSYTVPFDGGDFTLFGAYTHSGSRFSDIQNLQKLPAYDTLDLGAAVKFDKVELQLTATNLTNTLALTEGNARIVGTTGGSVIARSNFGRSFQATAVYRF